MTRLSHRVMRGASFLLNGSGSPSFNPYTYDWNANTGITVAPSSLTLVRGSVTLSGSSGWDSGSGTAADPYIWSGRHVRNDDDTTVNVIGDPTNTSNNVSSKLNVNQSYVKIVNCRLNVAIGGSTNTNVTYENCEIGLWDYWQGSSPTVDRYTGNAITSATYRQFWFNTSNGCGYYIDPAKGVNSWTWGAQIWTYMTDYDPTVGNGGSVGPVTPTTGDTWVKIASGQLYVFYGAAYYKWNGSAWTDISSQVCPDMVYNNDGQNWGGITPRDGAVLKHCRVFGVEDAVYIGGNQNVRLQYCWVRPNCTTRARYQPHGDLLQVGGVATTGRTFYIQRSRFESYAATASGIANMGSPYSSAMIFKTDFGPIDDILISESWINVNGAHCLQFRIGPAPWYTSSSTNLANKAQSTGKLCTSSDGGNRSPSTTMWKVTTAGTTGATEPSWPTTGLTVNSTTVTDGTVIWTYIGKAAPTNVRVRNNTFDTTGTLVDTSGETGGIWTGNKDTSGAAITLGSRGVPSSWVDDGDPTGEGLVLG